MGFQERPVFIAESGSEQPRPPVESAAPVSTPAATTVLIGTPVRLL